MTRLEDKTEESAPGRVLDRFGTPCDRHKPAEFRILRFPLWKMAVTVTIEI